MCNEMVNSSSRTNKQEVIMPPLFIALAWWLWCLFLFFFVTMWYDADS